jgi:uncharacterized membrane protein (UPF0127 family)/CheY-like chemotaxis protein
MRQTEAKLIINETRGNVVCEPAVIADRPLTRMRGLLGGRGLPAGEGLLLMPAPSIHTAFMRFVIDAVFLDSELRVLKLAPQLRPWRAASARHARAVLELADGEIARLGLEVGDRLALLDYAGAPAQGEPRLARVLIVGTDRRFRMLASAWLTRRGYHVTVRTGTDDIAELAARECVDVAVIDATPSLTAAARAVARLQTLRPSLAVVAVSDDLEQGLSALPVLPKWGQFSALCAAIDQAHGDQQVKDDDHAGR